MLRWNNRNIDYVLSLCDTEPVNHEWQGHEKAADEPLIRGQHLYPPDVINWHFCGFLLFIKHMRLSLFASSMWAESICISARELACALYMCGLILPLRKLKSSK